MVRAQGVVVVKRNLHKILPCLEPSSGTAMHTHTHVDLIEFSILKCLLIVNFDFVGGKKQVRSPRFQCSRWSLIIRDSKWKSYITLSKLNSGLAIGLCNHNSSIRNYKSKIIVNLFGFHYVSINTVSIKFLGYINWIRMENGRINYYFIRITVDNLNIGIYTTQYIKHAFY